MAKAPTTAAGTSTIDAGQVHAARKEKPLPALRATAPDAMSQDGRLALTPKSTQLSPSNGQDAAEAARPPQQGTRDP